MAVLSTGIMTENVTLALHEMENSDSIAHYHFGFVKQLDEKKLHKICKKYSTIITVEDGVKTGGFGSSILEFSAENDYVNEIFIQGIPDNFIEHGTVEELQHICKIDVKSLKMLFSEV